MGMKWSYKQLHVLNMRLVEKQNQYKKAQQELAQARFELENFVKNNQIKYEKI
jgi:hypothetical protein